MEDKRKSVRVGVNSVNSVVFYKPKNTRLASGSRIKDLSETGVCILLNRYFPPDSLFELEIRLDDFKGAIKTSGRIVRIDRRDDGRSSFEVGLSFLDLPLANRSMLNDYIRRSMA